jgi:hypothetical protein
VLLLGFADALTFTRTAVYPIKDGSAENWTLDSEYSSVVPLTKRFTFEDPANDVTLTGTSPVSILKKVSVGNDFELSANSLGAFTLRLRKELMNIAQTDTLAILNAFKEDDADDFKDIVKDSFIKPAVAKIFEDTTLEGEISAWKTAMAASGLLSVSGTTVAQTSPFVELVAASYDALAAINGDSVTAAVVSNIILAGILDNRVVVSDSDYSYASGYKPNDGLRAAYGKGVVTAAMQAEDSALSLYDYKGSVYNTNVISLAPGTSKTFKVKSAVNYGVYAESGLSMDLTNWLIPGYIKGVDITYNATEGTYTLSVPSSASNNRTAVLRFYRKTLGDSILEEDDFPYVDTNSDGKPDYYDESKDVNFVRNLYMENGLDIYRGGGSPSATTGGGGREGLPAPTANINSGIVENGTQVQLSLNGASSTSKIYWRYGDGPIDPGDVGNGTVFLYNPNDKSTWPVIDKNHIENGSSSGISTGGTRPPIIVTAIIVNGTQRSAVTTLLYTIVDGDIFLNGHIWYVRGYEGNEIRPDALITRAEVVTALYRLLSDDIKTEYGENNLYYTDVNYSDWYGLTVATLSNLNVVNGYEDGAFRPNDYITRAEMSAILSRISSAIPLSAETLTAFPDVADDYWAKQYIEDAQNKGYIEGYPDGTFKPDNQTTRSEFVTTVNRLLGRKASIANVLTFDGSEYLLAGYFVDLPESHWAYAAWLEAIHTHEYAKEDEEDENSKPLYDANGCETWTEITANGVSEAYNK